MDFVDCLQKEFHSRKSLNHRYSLRAFSRDLEISPSHLSEILNRKGNLSAQQFNRIFSQIGYTKIRQLSIDEFELVSDWVHFAVVSTMELDEFDGTPKWISNKLGLSILEIRRSLEKLERLQIVKKEDGLYKNVQSDLSTTNDIPSLALKHSHRQCLKQAIDAIDDIAIEDRDITAITMSIDKDKLKEAKKRIRLFRQELCNFLESGKKNEVYNLNIQLIPITKLEE